MYMFTLKESSVECPENDRDLFMRLYWDTTEKDLYDEEMRDVLRWRSYNSMWLGHVDRDNQEFRLRRVWIGNINRKSSTFMIEGKKIAGKVYFRIGFSWIAFVWLVVNFGVFIPLVLFLNSWVGWLILGVYVAVICKILVDDFRDTENLISAYLRNPEKVSKLVVK